MRTQRSIITGAVAAVVLAAAGATALEAQLPEYQLSPLRPSGDLVAPYFDGWYDNGDGTVTYSFGFMNRNTEEIVDVPLGENNFITPAEYDGVQPTHFPVYSRGGFNGKRERGAFTVTVPRGQEVRWTLSHAGHSYSIPGRATSTAYELSRGTAAEGSYPPAIRLTSDSPEMMGRDGPMADRVTARVGEPVTLSLLTVDRGEREGGELVPVTTTWLWHQGPAEIQFSTESELIEGEGWGQATTQATFTAPGDYMVRARVDNFRAGDSGFDYQCCWSNAYFPVTVVE